MPFHYLQGMTGTSPPHTMKDIIISFLLVLLIILVI